jgi:hypothetical protein
MWPVASLRARRVHCSTAACLYCQFLPRHQRVSQPLEQGEFHRSIVGGTVFCGTNSWTLSVRGVAHGQPAGKEGALQ